MHAISYSGLMSAMKLLTSSSPLSLVDCFTPGYEAMLLGMKVMIVSPCYVPLNICCTYGGAARCERLDPDLMHELSES